MNASDFLKQKAKNDTSLADSSPEQQKIAEDARAAAREEEIKKEGGKKQKKAGSSNEKIKNQGENLLERVTLRLPTEEKNEWESFFNELDYSVSLGIRKAVRYYMKQYKSGRIEI